MTITATTLKDSINNEGVRLITLQLRYPRFLHPELMTHRVFSRNASSSRAIPVEKLIQDVLDDPAMPSYWGKNQKGMQAREEVPDNVVYIQKAVYPTGERVDFQTDAKTVWINAMRNAVDSARILANNGYHKQIVNRLLEPFAHINVVVTATDWTNFFSLRLHADAQPEMRLLAEAMKEAILSSEPTLLEDGQWHLPYVDNQITGDVAQMVSAARCARVSYLTREGKETTVEEDLALAGRLLASGHMSPFEHQATPDIWLGNGWMNESAHGNLYGWKQLRHLLG